FAGPASVPGPAIDASPRAACIGSQLRLIDVPSAAVDPHVAAGAAGGGHGRREQILGRAV
ncbi:MAG: hypothetical protein ABIL09_02245, partial [Gemmatimonadota bacterium]